ncbi:MAG: hypothetical protein U0793_29160 [Gemmataceae bacterium]
MILLAFEEEGWPPRLLDPLPGKENSDPKTRLNQAIRHLNDGQRILRFRGDGTGRGILWEAVLGPALLLRS